MIPQSNHRFLDAFLRYGAALLLALAAQLARLPLDSPTAIPNITYVPFIVTGAALGGLGPGLLTTVLCTVESLYFAIRPLHTLSVVQLDNWIGLGTLAFTGMVASILLDRLIRARREAEAVVKTRVELAQEVETRRHMLESMIQNSPAATALLTGADFTFQVINPSYQALAPGEPMIGRSIAEVWPKAAPVVMPLLKAVRDTETPYLAQGFALPLHRGRGTPSEMRYFDFSYVPLRAFGAAGDLAVLVVAIEVTGYKSAEDSLRVAYSELAAIYDNAPVALLVVDDQLRVEKVNDLAAQFGGRKMAAMLGVRPGHAIGCLNALADPAGCGHGPACFQCPLRNAVLDALGGGTGHHRVEGWLPLSGRSPHPERCLLISTAAMTFADSRKVLICAQDITELKDAQVEVQRREESLRQTVGKLESALAEKTVLLQEVHHRVKNNLAVVSSLLGMKANSAVSCDAKIALEESQQRVHSMALIHELLYGNENLDRVDFAQYARQLVQGQYASGVNEHGQVSIEMDLDPIELDIERAVPSALILNELLSNACKYAFPDGRSGTILVRFRECAPGSLELAVEDDGIGLPPGRLAARNTKSLGLRIVGILARQLDGSLAQEGSTGTRIVLRFPVPVAVLSR